jgi:hypothetical protein
VRTTRGRRRHRDDVPCSTTFHPWQQALDGEEGRREVAVHRRAPAVLGELLERTRHREAAARIDDEDVDLTELPLDVEVHPLDFGELRHVGGEARCFATPGADRLLHRPESGCVASMERARAIAV